jgi:hypothetical protein
MKMMTIILVLFCLQTYAQEECIFDQSTQNAEFIQDIPEFKNYSWNDNTKEATIILSDGDTLIAHRGGCDHFGISGTLKLSGNNTDITDLDYWFKKCSWIAKRIFSSYDYQDMMTSIRDRTYSDQSNEELTFVVFQHESYSEFAMMIKRVEHSTIVSIGYYYN